MLPAQKVGIVLVLMASASCAFADFELGYSYYEAKNFAKAYKEFMLSAELGDVESQFNLGVMFYRGEHVAKSLADSFAWLSLAKDGQSALAGKTLPVVAKKMTPQDLAQGQELYKTLKARYSDIEIQKRLAPNTQSTVVMVDPYKVIKTVKPNYPAVALKLNNFGVVDVSFTVAKDGSTRDFQMLLPNPSFDRPTFAALRQWQYQPAMRDGKPRNSYGALVRFNYALGSIGNVDAKKVNAHLSRAKTQAINGSAQDMYNYAAQTDVFQSIVNGTEDKEKSQVNFDNANDWYFKAAVGGLPLAEFKIGVNMLAGRMCAANPVGGLGWLERAATKGVIDAQFYLGLEYYEGIVSEPDPVKGIYWLDRASKNSFANASLKLAKIYATSTDDKLKNAIKAREYLNLVKADHLDQLTFWEVTAAVFAIEGDYKQAIKAQEKALELSRDYGLELPVQSLQLASYQASRPWLE